MDGDPKPIVGSNVCISHIRMCIWKLYYSSFDGKFRCPIKTEGETSAVVGKEF